MSLSKYVKDIYKCLILIIIIVNIILMTVFSSLDKPNSIMPSFFTISLVLVLILLVISNKSKKKI